MGKGIGVGSCIRDGIIYEAPQLDPAIFERLSVISVKLGSKLVPIVRI